MPALGGDGDNSIERRFVYVREQSRCGKDTGIIKGKVQLAVGFHRGRDKIFYVLATTISVRVFCCDFADLLTVFTPPKRIGLRSNIRLSRVLIKSFSITSSDVSTHFRPVLKRQSGGLDLR